MKRMVMALGLIIGSFAMANAQLLVENFEYADDALLTANGWAAHSGGGTQPVTVSPTMLTFTGYAYSGLSKSALMDNNGEDVNRTFTSVTDGPVYISFMVNVVNVVSGHFFDIAENPISASILRGRIWIGGTNSGMSFGLSFGANTATSTATTYVNNTTYLVVLKYNVIAGAGNDEASLFIIDSTIPGSEPLTPTIGPLTIANDLPSVTTDINPGSIALRQFNVSQNMLIGGIRVGTSWAETGLPVELSAFSVSASGKSALLKWETTTEKNNAGFEVLRNGQSVGFVSGKGTTTEKQTYTFTDKNVSGSASYQLKQVDTDGKTSLSQILSFVATPVSFEVTGNYPNPFNPSTTIKFTLPEVSNVVVKVHNIIGQEIATLVNGKMNAGVQEVRFDASNLSSGVYFYSVSANGKTVTKSMTLMK
ncbi:MAG: T9SS type A sorting domain-containing protein [Bacteroidetes bacterium]|nr:T9SS type A sorting domain-containing protein [Bacteroidota bacterium]